MDSKSQELLLEIARIKDNIRRKYSALRNNRFESQRQLAIKYKPLIQPLKEIAEKNNKRKIKKEPKIEPKDEPEEEPQEEEEEESSGVDEEEVPSLPSTSDEDVLSLSSSDADDGEVEQDPSGNVDALLAQYLNFLIQDNKSEADFTYGIVYNDGWRMGRYPVQFINNDIVIRGKRYKGTPGLFELVFKKHPSNVFTEEDLSTYKNMLEQSKAHEGKDGKVISNRGYKYTNIISNMFPPKKRLIQDILLTPLKTRAKRALSQERLAGIDKKKKTGDGIMIPLTGNRIDYRHWDDPNELCDRLRLLIASRQAGNNSLDGEIVSILEELKESGVIKDFGNVRI